jgi:hypothetical protein
MLDGSAYGVFLDNTYRSNFDFGKESRDFLPSADSVSLLRPWISFLGLN